MKTKLPKLYRHKCGCVVQILEKKTRFHDYYVKFICIGTEPACLSFRVGNEVEYENLQKMKRIPNNEVLKYLL